MIVPTAEGSGAVVLSTPASSSKGDDDWWFVCGNSRPRGGCAAEVRKGRAKEVRVLDEFEVNMDVDESDRHRARKSGQNVLKHETT